MAAVGAASRSSAPGADCDDRHARYDSPVAPAAQRLKVDAPEAEGWMASVLPEIRRLVGRMATDNPSWGYTRIQHALKNGTRVHISLVKFVRIEGAARNRIGSVVRRIAYVDP